MPLKLNKPAGAPAANGTAPQTTSAPASALPSMGTPALNKTSTGLPSMGQKPQGMAPPNGGMAPPQGGATGAPQFLKTGMAAKQAIQEDEAAAEIASELAGKPRRFWIGEKNLNKDYDLTFLDGALDTSGELALNAWAEHMYQVSGKWRNFVCLQPGYCPFCAVDDRPAALVCAFTVVDHTPYTIQQGKRAGETVVDERRLYVAKRNTLGQLQKIATQYQGLRGVRVTVSRTSTRVATVGDMILPQGKYNDQQLASLGKDDKGNRKDVPFDYKEAAPYFGLDELKQLGIGSAGNVIGAEPKQDIGHKL